MPSKALLLRLMLLIAALALLWRLALAMPEAVHGAVAQRLLQGALLSAGVLALVATLLRRDRLTWRVAGWRRRRGSHVRAFATGAALWLLPAAAGVALCLSLGWATLSPAGDPARLALSLPSIALAVFLSEAFPEELALRGYAQGVAERAHPAWVALLVQLAAFVGFAWAAGALDSLEAWMLIPGMGLILGYARALSGQVWTCIGIHWAWMTSTQWLLGGFEVTGTQTLLFLAFVLLPSTTIGLVMSLRCPEFDWHRRH